MGRKRKYNFLFVLLIFVFSVSFSSAQNYYADITVIIDKDGSVDISGPTNYLNLFSIKDNKSFTVKNEKFWTINLTTSEKFSQYIMNVEFPESTSLNYLEASNVLSIKEEGGKLIVTIIGDSEPIHFMAQYSYEETKSIGSLSFILIALGIIIICSLIAYYRKTNISKKINFDNLTDRQTMIVKELDKNKGKITQKKLEKILNIPKASLSRNIDSLVKKNIILKDKKGLTNILRLNYEPDTKR